MSRPIEPEGIRLLDSWIHPVALHEATGTIARAARDGEGGYVCLANAHTVSLGRSNPRLRDATNSSLLALADGKPLVWAAKLLGIRGACHVRGADLLRGMCEVAARESLSVYFYGGDPAVTPRLIEILTKKYPDLKVSGYDCPPFRTLTAREDAEAVERIHNSGAQILWVGLGAPKQEIWMLEHRQMLPRVVMVGVGAAFDFVAGAIPEAPRWLRVLGMEWLHRMMQDPRRLWRRYLVFNSRFALLTAMQLLRDRSSGRR